MLLLHGFLLLGLNEECQLLRVTKQCGEARDGVGGIGVFHSDGVGVCASEDLHVVAAQLHVVFSALLGDGGSRHLEVLAQHGCEVLVPVGSSHGSRLGCLSIGSFHAAERCDLRVVFIERQRHLSRAVERLSGGQTVISVVVEHCSAGILNVGIAAVDVGHHGIAQGHVVVAGCLRRQGCDVVECHYGGRCRLGFRHYEYLQFFRFIKHRGEARDGVGDGKVGEAEVSGVALSVELHFLVAQLHVVFSAFLGDGGSGHLEVLAQHGGDGCVPVGSSHGGGFGSRSAGRRHVGHIGDLRIAVAHLIGHVSLAVERLSGYQSVVGSIHHDGSTGILYVGIVAVDVGHHGVGEVQVVVARFRLGGERGDVLLCGSKHGYFERGACRLVGVVALVACRQFHISLLDEAGRLAIVIDDGNAWVGAAPGDHGTLNDVRSRGIGIGNGGIGQLIGLAYAACRLPVARYDAGGNALGGG